MRKPWIKNKDLALALGLLFFVAGAALLYDRYEHRGDTPPRILRPFTWW